MVKKLVDNSNKKLKDFKGEIFDNDEILDIVKKIEKETLNLEEDDDDMTIKNFKNIIQKKLKI